MFVQVHGKYRPLMKPLVLHFLVKLFEEIHRCLVPKNNLILQPIYLAKDRHEFSIHPTEQLYYCCFEKQDW